MSKAAAVKEAVKESLLGAEEPVQLSAQTKARFVANAVKDEVSGELYMGPDEFTKAVAPEDEDFVSPVFHSHLILLFQFVAAAGAQPSSDIPPMNRPLDPFY